jgi:hypothetical protein
MTYGMSFKSLAAFPQVGMGQEMLDAIEADLQAIGD